MQILDLDAQLMHNLDRYLDNHYPHTHLKSLQPLLYNRKLEPSFCIGI